MAHDARRRPRRLSRGVPQGPGTSCATFACPQPHACRFVDFATLECEFIERSRFRTQAEARLAVFEYLEGWYNPHRRHSALGQRSPMQPWPGILIPGFWRSARGSRPELGGKVGSPPACSCRFRAAFCGALIGREQHCSENLKYMPPPREGLSQEDAPCDANFVY